MSRRPGQVISKGKERWLVRIHLGEDGSTGTRRLHSKTIHGSKSDAERYLRTKLKEQEDGFLVGSNLTVGEYLDYWLDNAVETRVRPRTLADYKRSFDKHVRPALGERQLSKLRPLHLQKLYADIAKAVSAHAATRTHRPLSAALKQAVRWQLIAVNPADGAQAPRESRGQSHVLTAEQASRFREAAAGHSRGFIFTFSLATGMRPGEAQALQWKDCNLEKGEVEVRRNLVWLGHEWQFGEPKTKLSRRTIPLPRSVVAELRTHRAEQAKKRLAIGEAYTDLDLVFASDAGEPFNRQNLYARALKPILVDAFGDPTDKRAFKERLAALPSELRDFRWYDCRHTCATLLLAAGENPKVVSERLGHSTVAFTLDRYAHVMPGMQEAASAKLEAMLYGEHA